MQRKDTEFSVQQVTDTAVSEQTTAKAGQSAYSTKSEAEKASNTSKKRPASGGKGAGAENRQDATQTSACERKRERTFTPEQVSRIVSDRVNRLNERIAALEVENAILRSRLDE